MTFLTFEKIDYQNVAPLLGAVIRFKNKNEQLQFQSICYTFIKKPACAYRCCITCGIHWSILELGGRNRTSRTVDSARLQVSFRKYTVWLENLSRKQYAVCNLRRRFSCLRFSFSMPTKSIPIIVIVDQSIVFGLTQHKSANGRQSDPVLAIVDSTSRDGVIEEVNQRQLLALVRYRLVSEWLSRSEIL